MRRKSQREEWTSKWRTDREQDQFRHSKMRSGIPVIPLKLKTSEIDKLKSYGRREFKPQTSSLWKLDVRMRRCQGCIRKPGAKKGSQAFFDLEC